MVEALDMKVRWALGWGNKPTLAALVSEIPAPREERHLIAVERGHFLIDRDEPVVRYVFESARGGGALGGTYRLQDGSVYRTNGGWSSNPGAVNALRRKNPAAAALLPHDVVGVTLYVPGHDEGGWCLTGMAGINFDVPWVEEQLARFCPGVRLFDMSAPTDVGSEDEADADQAAVFRRGGSAYGYCPFPESTPFEKPSEDSDLYLRTRTPRP